uniref:WDR19 first beta-propeller domain-containing protein n=1 Tax=Strombidinopsis acuminata TaxID=141414 RepID=A0A7S3SAW4_9SPIT
MRARPLIILNARELGTSTLKPAWQPRGPLLAVACQSEQGLLVQIYDTSSKAKLRSHQFDKGVATFCEWDSSGTTLAVMQAGVGIHLWECGIPTAGVRGVSGPPSPRPMALAHNQTATTSCAMWSHTNEQLAIGTTAGKVLFYNKKQVVLQANDRKGKHGAAVTCGEWLSDNRLGMASGNRIKISRPLAPDDAEWETQVKFKLTGQSGRLPKKIKAAGAPRMLAFSLGEVPHVAVCVGEAYILIFSTGSNPDVSDDLGLTFPDDYGTVVGFAWDENEVRAA